MLTRSVWSRAIRSLVQNVNPPKRRTVTGTRFQSLDLEPRVLLSATQAAPRVMAAPNLAPVVTASGTSTYTEDADPVLVASTATVTDSDSANLSGGKLVIRISANAQSDDRILIRNEGRGAGQVGVNGSKLLYGGKTVGSISGGKGTTPLTITFNSHADAAVAEAVLQNIGFATPSQNPSTATRTLTVTLSDGDGGTSSPQTLSVQVVSVDDAPVFMSTGSGATYFESGTPVLLSPSASVTDVDSTNFAGGSLTVQITQNDELGDQLAIRNQGTAAGQIGFSGGIVTYGGVAIGTAVGNQTDTLVVTLNGAANATSVKALVRNITFAATGVNPSSADRRVQYSLDDGDGATGTAMVVAHVKTINDPPVVANIGSSVNYVRGDDPVFLAQSATVADSDSLDFANGKLTVRITANAKSSDGIAIFSDGFDPGQLGVDGDGIYYGDVLFGRVSGGIGSTPLTVSFNANATPEAVQALVRNLGFFSDNLNGSTATRTISFQVTDGDGGTSAAVTEQVFLT